MRSSRHVLVFLPPVLALVAMLSTAAEPYVILIVRESRGVVSVPLDFQSLGQALGKEITSAPEMPLAALETPAGLVPLPSQFDPDPKTTACGTLSFLLPDSAPLQRLRVYLTDAHPDLGGPRGGDVLKVQRDGARIVIAAGGFTVTHDPAQMGGLPCSIELAGKALRPSFNDRVHDPKVGGFNLRDDPRATIELLANGPLIAKVLVHAHFTQKGKEPPGQPEAWYTFVYTAGSPLVRVEAGISQREAFAWNELHFLELDFPAGTFTNWAAGEPWHTGVLKADKKSYNGSFWAALSDGKSTLGILSGERAIVYDGTGDYMYVHGPWVQWREKERKFSAQLWLGSAQDAEHGLRAVGAAATKAAAAEVTVTTPGLEKLLQDLQEKLQAMPTGGKRGRYAWRISEITRLVRAGALTEALVRAVALEQAKVALVDESLCRYSNEDLGLALSTNGGGMDFVSFYDLRAERELLAAAPAPLWRIELRSTSGETATLDAASGWCDHKSDSKGDGKGTTKAVLHWLKAADARFAGIRVKVEVELKGARSSWQLEVKNESKTWSIERVVFPQVALGRIGPSELDDRFVYPSVSGQLVEAPLTRSFSYKGLYPECVATMQFFAHYDNDCGLYIAAHDPLACTKELHAEHLAGAPALTCSFGVLAENIGVPGNSFQTSGKAVLETFHGDWFDAAQIYKRWVEREAKWCPPAGERNDTPRWMRELPLWAQTGGDIKHVVSATKACAEYMGVPMGLHWYTWHQIPFDNSYPHYFPAKPGFVEGVKELQAAGVRVMPYINGRLWDSGLDDFKDGAIASASKDEHGRCYIEEYGSGRKLAPMCPVTPLWQNTVRDIVLRLMGPEGGVDAVYIDQIAAAAPRPCFDKTHGHPLGGGHWWTKDGYWKMLAELRAEMKERYSERMLTTECNAEPYARWLDGYLTWNFQFQDQIPLFAAVYGGKLQMFGRAYRGGPTKDLALRMKAAQSFVFGEQIGWMDPNVCKDPVGGPFIRRVARLRYALRDYFIACSRSGDARAA
ncbi:MAG: DUF6259 domain-containing protein, partial [Planctomycetota bacterium]